MKKDELITKREFPQRVGVTFDILRQWAAVKKLDKLEQLSTKPRGGRGANLGLYSLNQALEYKKQKEAIRPVKSEGGK